MRVPMYSDYASSHWIVHHPFSAQRFPVAHSPFKFIILYELDKFGLMRLYQGKVKQSQAGLDLTISP